MREVTYQDIVPDYETYLSLQTGMFQSFESTSEHIKDAMKEALVEFFDYEKIPYDAYILDAACGDGLGINLLNSIGYKRVIGIDANTEKASKHLYANVGDLHDKEVFSKNEFDVIFSSHTLEHMYRVGDVLDNFYQWLVPGGKLFIIIPFPDYGDERAHGGKYYLKTHQNNIPKILSTFVNHDFIIDNIKQSCKREPELWLWMHK